MFYRVGQLLGPYRLNSLIGQGGSGEVYLAEHIHLNTLRAIKILSVKLTSDEFNDFEKEAQIIAHLDHPNIIRVLDFNLDNNVPYLVMDFANGNLRSRHPRGTRLPLNIIVSYVKQIASALQFAHEQNIIHRDVKPENLLVGRNDEILLSDFGIALVGSSTNSRPPQNMAGTPVYMSPEQINGHPSRASDQYGLGVIVYEWLCGSPPFHGSFTELVFQHMVASPPSLREIIPSISLIIEQVILKALAKDAQQRFATIQEFANALEEAVLQSEAGEEALEFRQSAPEMVETIDGNSLAEHTTFTFLPPCLEDDTIHASNSNPLVDLDTPGIIVSGISHSIQNPDFFPTIIPTIRNPLSGALSFGVPQAEPEWVVSEEDIGTVLSSRIFEFQAPASTAVFESLALPLEEMHDSFIIYHREDREWAEWIAWQLDNAQFSTILPVWGVLPGTDIELELHKAERKAKRTILLLSPNFFRTFANTPNWIDPLKRDAIEQQNKIVSIYIRDYRGKHRKHLASINYIDLSKTEAESARKVLIEVMRGEYIKPVVEPPFPGPTLRRQTSKEERVPNKEISQNDQPSPQENDLSTVSSFSTSTTLILAQGIELAYVQQDWPDVIRKVNLLIKRTPDAVPERFYYLQGAAYLEEGDLQHAHETFNDALAQVIDRQQRLTMLHDCATLMISKALWNEVIPFCREALRLLPNDPGWLSLQNQTEDQIKIEGGGKRAKPQHEPLPLEKTKNIEIFFSYSHRDKKYRDELDVYLAPLKRLPSVKAWYDGEISAGSEFEPEILKHLSVAHIILLLISPHFIASDYCYNIEMQHALARHEAKETRVIPIILHETLWKNTPIGKLQALPTDARAITSWSNRRQAFSIVTSGIQKEIEKLSAKL